MANVQVNHDNDPQSAEAEKKLLAQIKAAVGGKKPLTAARSGNDRAETSKHPTFIETLTKAPTVQANTPGLEALLGGEAKSAGANPISQNKYLAPEPAVPAVGSSFIDPKSVKEVKYVTSKMTDEPTFLDLLNGGTANSGGQRPDTERIDPYDPKILSDDELKVWLEDHPKSEGARNEVAARQIKAQTSLTTRLVTPETAGRTLTDIVGHVASGALSTMDPMAVYPSMFGMLPDWVPGAKAAREQGADQTGKIRDLFSVREPTSFEESIPELAGSLLLPIGDVQGELSTMGKVIEAATPLIVGKPTVPKLMVNLAVGTGLTEVIHKLIQDGQDPYKSLFDYANVPNIPKNVQNVTTPIVTATLGGVLPVLMAAPLIPAALRHVWMTQPPRLNQGIRLNEVRPGLPYNVVSFETASAQAKAQILDPNLALKEMAARNGFFAPEELDAQFADSTGNSLSVRVQNGLSRGTVRGPYTDFHVETPLKILEHGLTLVSPEQASDYKTYINLVSQYRRRISAFGISAGQAMAATRKQIADFEAKYPMIKGYMESLHENLQEAWRFSAEGPYSILSKADLAELRRMHGKVVPHVPEVIDPNASTVRQAIQAGTFSPKDMATPSAYDSKPWMVKDMTLDTPTNFSADPIEVVTKYVRRALQDQTRNNLRGQYVEKMLGSAENLRLNQRGQSIIRELTDADIERASRKGATADLNDRIVTVWKDGKEVKYVTSKMTAQLLRFDPFAALNMFDRVGIMQRRMFETVITGPWSLTFAATTLMRDSISGWVNTAKGTPAPGVFSSIGAVPHILTDEFNAHLADIIHSNFVMGLPTPYTTKAQLKPIIDAANSTLAVLFHEHGGFEGSISKAHGGSFLNEGMQEFYTNLKNDHPAFRVMENVYGASVGNLADMFSAMFHAVSEGPRMAAAKKLAKGLDPKDPAWNDKLSIGLEQTRGMTGDTSKRGMSYDGRGRFVSADVNDDQLVAKSLANVAGWAAHNARNWAMFTNPTLQGMAKAVHQASTDPARWISRNWVAVAMPAIVSHAWNTILSQNNADGENYLDHQFNLRSMRDQVMNLYFGIPGLPADRGLQIPIAHETALFAAPYSYLLWSMSKDDKEVAASINQMGMTLLQNTVPSVTPPIFNVGANLMGNYSFDIGQYSSGGIREDYNGFLPANVEAALRNAIGNTGMAILNSSAAFVGEGPKAGVEQFQYDIVAASPVIKGLAGTKPGTAWGSGQSAEYSDALDKMTTWVSSYRANTAHPGLFQTPPKSENSAIDPITYTDELTGKVTNHDITIADIGSPTVPPTKNPIALKFGDMIYEGLMKKGTPFEMAQRQQGALTTLITQMKNARFRGRASENAAMKKLYESIDPDTELGKLAQKAYPLIRDTYAGTVYEEQMKALKLIKESKVDLNNSYDVNRLITLLEKDRYAAMSNALGAMHNMEDQITEAMIKEGLINRLSKARFSFIRDFGVADENPPVIKEGYLVTSVAPNP